MLTNTLENFSVSNQQKKPQITEGPVAGFHPSCQLRSSPPLLSLDSERSLVNPIFKGKNTRKRDLTLPARGYKFTVESCLFQQEKSKSMSDILLIRSKGNLVKQAVEGLQDEFPNADIDILTTSDAPVELEVPSSQYDRRYELEGSRFNLENMDEKLNQELTDRSYQRALILYDDLFDQDYVSVERMVDELEVNTLHGFVENKVETTFITLDSWTLKFRRYRKMITFPIALFLFVLLSPVMLMKSYQSKHQFGE